MRNIKTICSVLFCLLTFLTKGQANLVPNPSFETHTACPTGLEAVDYTVNWYAPTDGSPDYLDTCFIQYFPPVNPPQNTAPKNLMGYQNAFDGGGYIGLMTYEDDDPAGSLLYREYIQTKLTIPLSAGQKYFLSFYVSLADSSRFSTDGIGAYISNIPITLTGSPPASYANFSVNPQVSSPPGQLLSDAINWKKISGAFIATGGEQYITIGNFNNNSNTTIFRRLPSTLSFPSNYNAYYFVDEVCLSLSPQTCNVDPSVGIQSYTTIRTSFYYNPQSERIILEYKSLTVTIKIIDLFGNTIKTAALNNFTEFLDISDLSPGCYFVSITNSETSSVKKIIKN